MKKIATLVMTLVLLFCFVSTAHAQEITDGGDVQKIAVRKDVSGIKAQSLLPDEPVRVRKVSPKDCKTMNWHPELSYYYDNPYRSETFYQDYLEDVAWFFDQYPNACQFPVEPEPLN